MEVKALPHTRDSISVRAHVEPANPVPTAHTTEQKVKGTGTSAFLLVLRYCSFQLLSEFVNLI